MTLYWAPATKYPKDEDWVQIGYTDKVEFGFDGSYADETVEYVFPTTEPSSMSFTFNLLEMADPKRLLSLLCLGHPVKGAPYVGKKYRQACRQWQRLSNRKEH